MRSPRLEAGKIYHLSHKSGTPADIYVEMVYMKPGSKEWMYRIISEANNGQPVYVPESAISDRLAKRKSKVYQNEFVVKLMDDGFRFAGNYHTVELASSAGEVLAKNPNINDVMLHRALDSYGNQIDGYGVWIRWNTIIHGDGYCDAVNHDTPIRIK